VEVRASSLAGDIAQQDQEKVLEGKEGWLFLARDTNHVIHQHTGRLRFSERALEDWRQVLETRVAWLGRREIPYIFMVPPNTHAVYPEYLPDDVVAVAERPVLQLIAYLRERGSKARIIYPLEELVAHKQHDLVYIKTDSHWNELGAFIAYKRLMREIADVATVRDIQWDQLFVSRAEMVGDLGAKLRPERSSTQVFVDVRGWQAHYARDNRVRVKGRRIDYRCRLAPDVTCLVHGDSFTEKLLHVLAESFGRTVFCQMPSLDYQVVQQVRPDVVIGLHNERFLLEVPYDSSAPTLAELAASKVTQGRVYGPRTTVGTPRVDSFL
jgi:alginate O-acetyltransferase complex protein AlgJ